MRCNSSAPRSANIGFIFRMTANSACLLIVMPSRIGPGPNPSEPLAKFSARYEVCHKSHNFAAPPEYFWLALSRFPLPG